MTEFIDPQDLLRNDTFSQVAIATGSRVIHTSGQVSIDREGNLVGAGDLALQTRQAMSNVASALNAAGATFADVVKTTTFVVGFDPGQRKLITDAKKPFWEGRRPPPSALIGISTLAQAGWLIEIEAIAVID